MSSIFTNALEQLSEYSASDVYHLVMEGYYFPTHYFLHAIFVAFNIRVTTPKKGLSWYRSLLTGYLMSVAPRFLLGYITTQEMPEFQNFASFFCYLIIWTLFNICPFDIIFKFCRRPSTSWVIAILDSFSNAQNIYQSVNSCITAIGGAPIKIAIMTMFSVNGTIFVDFLDRYICGERKKPMAYAPHIIKRNMLYVFVLVLLGCPGVFDDEGPFYLMTTILPFICIIHVVITIIDIIIYEGEIFQTFDYVLKDFFLFMPYRPEYNYRLARWYQLHPEYKPEAIAERRKMEAAKKAEQAAEKASEAPREEEPVAPVESANDSKKLD